MNDNFCFYPWVGLNFGSYGDIKPCCKFRPEVEQWGKHKLSKGIDSYIASQDLNNLKQQFLNGEKPQGCIRCWEDERAGFKSMRQMDNDRWSNELANVDLTKNKYFFFNFPITTLCNFKCRICGPHASSSWIKEYRDLYGSVKQTLDWYSDETIANRVIELCQDAVDMHLHGGEPFLYNNVFHLRLLESLIETGNSKRIRIHYSTNCSVFPEQKYWDYWQHFKSIDLQCSIDDIEHRFEYVRYPADWIKVDNNLLQYNSRIKEFNNITFSISSTVSNFTIFYLEELLDYFTSNDLPEPYLGRVHNPEYFRPNILIKPVKEQVLEKLYSSKYDSVRKTAEWVMPEFDITVWDTFLGVITKHDRYRNQNFQKVFPEIFDNIG